MGSQRVGQDIATKQRPQTARSRPDDGRKEDLEAGQAVSDGEIHTAGNGEPFGSQNLILHAWQGGAPCPAELSRGTSALSHALRTHCWNNHFLGSPQRILLSCHGSANPLCGQGRPLQRQSLFALRAVREGPGDTATAVPALCHYPHCRCHP